MFDGALDSTGQAEVVAWSTLFWQRVANGGGSPGTGFSFTNADMNSPLFNPLRAARPTLEKVGLVSATACDQLGTLIPMDDPGVADMWKSFQDIMTEGKISTDWTTDADGTTEHANLILAAPASEGSTVYVDGTKLVSLDLPLQKVSTDAYNASLKEGISQQSQDIIAAMIASGAQWSIDAGTVTEAQKLITGQASQADNFAATVQGMLDVVGVSGSSVQTIVAQFGVYGSLNVVAIQLGDALVLMDPLSGNSFRSVQPSEDSALDASGL